ncbi:branched-chain amino acid transport system II carrier protein [Vaginisenegalia massiliensis]|uniref:branched-chain amino acid transport system II carrier protein n=1 Tax=Vaginisenegalia massiliensis TaxID=2058294 RepID=UPI000F54A6B1|nr:branched-chain amino acid transport system II carrier protein [Vaginisenegalia massiliensis]
MKTKQLFIVGFMLFAMFFGAGNLIFPTALGFNAGQHFIPAICGFILTGVGLPLIGMIVGSISQGGYRQAIYKIHPVFSFLFLSAIYLTIGPFFAIPRTATTAYEIGLVPFLDHPSGFSLLVYTGFFFLVTFLIAVKPNQLSNAIGKFLTPALLLTILALIIQAIHLYHNHPAQEIVNKEWLQHPLASGFTEGYLTMDTLAAIAFSIVVLNSIQALGIENRRDLMLGTIKSSFIAAALLVLIYAALGWAGNHVDLAGAQAGKQNLGTFLLIFISHQGFGKLGIALLGTIVFLACLTTSTGLIAAVSEYFHSLFPRLSYEAYAVIFTLLSLVLANQGLDQVIKTSVPILSILYPISISVIVLIIVASLWPTSRLSLQVPLALVSLLSLFTVLQRFSIIDFAWLKQLPLYESQLEWLPVLVIGYIVGYGLGYNQEVISFND